MIKIGLTGSIGSGKSIVSTYFKKWGCYIFDADEEAIFPCGVSRQRMSEFGVEDVIVVHKDSFEKYKFDDVLPYNNKIKFKDQIFSFNLGITLNVSPTMPKSAN